MEREKLIVAVDFGTTFSGIAFCHSNQKELNDIEVYTSWSNNGVAPKLPTEIRYVPGRDPLWGAEASLALERRQVANSAIIYGRFKLLLDVRGGTGLYKDPSGSRNMSSSDRIQLPPGKSAINVSSDYLRLLYNELMENILPKRIPNTLDVTPIQFIFTVPAIWGHQAQEATKLAAKRAGFCSRRTSTDTLSLVSEPEAAALFVLKAMHEANFSRISTRAVPSLGIGDSFVVCDAGGGTVDLISYEVEEVTPGFHLKEAVIGTGGKCGSSYIDEAFIKLLRQKIGPQFDDEKIWSKKDISRGSNLMNKFDSIKRSFGQTKRDVWYLDLPVRVDDDEPNGIIGNELEFTAQELKQLFDPIVEKVINLVKGQVKSIRDAGKPVSAIFLVGGFGESHYLYQSLVKWADIQYPPIAIINPKESWSAIMRGAVVHAVNPAIKSRRLRQHYGFPFCPRFNPSIHPVSRLYLSPFGGSYARDVMNWSGHMGDSCSEEKELVFSLGWDISTRRELIEGAAITLYGSKSDTAPMYMEDSGSYILGMIDADFSSVSLDELQSTYRNEGGVLVKYYLVRFEVKMKLLSAEVVFSIWLKGRLVGKIVKGYTTLTCELDHNHNIISINSLDELTLDTQKQRAQVVCLK